MDEQSKLIKPAYQLESDDIIKQLGSSYEGLMSSEANKRLEQYGQNQLERVDKDPLIFKFLRQFKDLMLILLLVSAGLATYLEDYRTALILVIIVLVNAGIGFWQEFKAENIMSSLERLVVPTAKVYRDERLTEVPSADIVPGDVLYIAEGDSVPADARILSENELSTNDFALTGESNPSRKFSHALKNGTELPLRHNLVFMGTTVATGDAKVMVIGTGMHTELGRIANLSQSTKQDLSPLQKEMNHIARTITKGTLVMSAILMAITLNADWELKEAFVFAIGIAAAMIPQGLPAEVNTALTNAASRLAKAKALVKRLSAVESLGATSIIATDKTGTLTKNEMTVEQLYINETAYWVSGTGYQANGKIIDAKKKELPKNQLENYKLFFSCAVFASNASIHQPDDRHAKHYVLGDPTEGALITMAEKAGFNNEGLNKSSPELKEFTFDSVRKRMSSIRKVEGSYFVFAKGAPESMLESCSRILINGHVRKLTKSDIEHINARNDLLAHSAMRNLILAYKPVESTDLSMQSAESDLIFLGMASMIDPPREEVKQAMIDARRAGIPVSIITGDNALTATAIAIKAGLADSQKDLKLVLGKELKNMDDSQIIHLLERGQVIFSRVAPEDKLRIVELGKSANKVVAVTGDGINDAPALKRADIGVAMGITGTDVAKQSADIVLLDDSFRTLVGAIQQGRVIFQNIKKATLSCLTSNTGELFTVLISLLFSYTADIPIAITAVLILAIDLMAELFPIAALGWDQADSQLMDDKPRNPKNHILNRKTILDLALSGLVIGALAYTNYILFFLRDGQDPLSVSSDTSSYASAITVTYITICMCQFVNILARRTRSYRQSFFSSYLWSNHQLLIAFGISIIGILAIAYVPFIQDYLGSGAVGLLDWSSAIIAAVIYLVIRRIAIVPLVR